MNISKTIKKITRIACAFILSTSVLNISVYASEVGEQKPVVSVPYSAPIRIERATAVSSAMSSIPVRSGSSVSISASASTSDFTEGFETTVEKVIKKGYGQKVEKRVSDDRVEFIVHNMVVDKNKVYADLSFKLLDSSEYSRVNPRFNLDFGEPKIESPKRHEILGFLPYIFNPNATATGFSYSMGYNMSGETNEDDYYEISLNADLRESSSNSVKFNLDEIELSEELKYTYTPKQWLENPVEGIEILSIEFSNNELFLKAQSKDDGNFVITQKDGENNYPSSSSHSSNDGHGLSVITSYWKLEDDKFDLETSEISFVMYKQLESIVCDLSIEVPIDNNKIIKPIYNKDLNKTVSSILGDVTIINVEVTPLTINLTYEMKEIDRYLPYRAAPVKSPDDLESYKNMIGADEKMYRNAEHELLKVEVDGEQVYVNSANTQPSKAGKVIKSLSCNGSSDINNITISVLQEDETYKEISIAN